MIFNKTNSKIQQVITNRNSSSSSSSSSNGNYVSNGGDRYIWGQHDTGDDDINGNLYANGNLYVSSQGEAVYDEDDDDEDEKNPSEGSEDNDDESRSSFDIGNLDEIFDTDKGNLYVENKLRVDGEIETNEAYIKKTLYVPHPDTKVKTDIMELFKDWDDRISSNTTEINNLKNRVNQCEIDIDNLDSKIITINGDITTIKNDITTINNKITNLESADGGVTEEKVKELIEEAFNDYDRIQILAAGQLNYTASSSTTTEKITFNGMTNKCKFELVERKQGLLTIKLVETDSKYWVQIWDVQVIQAYSQKTLDLTKTDIDARNQGSHWFEARTDESNRTTIYIREFHNADNDEDAWRSNNWDANNSVKGIQILVIGRLMKHN